jgi:aminoglycoside phosphotransferase (APT) family kinase protein
VTSPDGLPGLPAEPIAQWLRRMVPGDLRDQSWSAELISGGLSNLTYRVRRGTDRLVIRRPPLGPTLPRAHDMHREYRALTALGPTLVPVPEALAFCSDTTIIGAPFYVMREVPGTVLRRPDDAARLSADQRTRLSEHLVDVLADLHALDLDATGLADFGRHGGYAARQLRTWGEQWRRSRTRDVPDMDRLIIRLGEDLPGADETTLVHGDYRLDNAVVQTGPVPHVAAVLDWELATLGDPVADLATLLTYWHDTGDEERSLITVAAGLTTFPGFLTTSALAERYAVRTGRDLSTLTFHRALAAMKLGVILEGVHSRYIGGKAIGEGYAAAGTAVPVLAARGLRLLAAPAR